MADRPVRTDLSGDIFVGASERDGVTLVRDASKRTLPKRFYKDVRVDGREDAFAILLDERPVRTPKGAPLALPTREAAECVAAEWVAQGDAIDAATMPTTRLVNSALDGVAADIGAVAADVVKYAGSDLVCYRAAEPEALVAAQDARWNPLLELARDRFGARLNVAQGLMFVSQPAEALAAIAREVERITKLPHAAFRVAAVHVVTTLTGSAVLALCVAANALSCDDAWTAAHVDEDEQMRVWGFDAEALRRRASRFAEMKAACALLDALR